MRPNQTTPTRAALLAAMIVTSAAPAHADTYVTWDPPNQFDRFWSSSEWWSLEAGCGLYPHRGKQTCCNCSTEDNWFVTLADGVGARLDVDVELAGLQHDVGQIDMEGHTILVFNTATIGDGDPVTLSPTYYDNSGGFSALMLMGATSFLDDHTYFQLEYVTNGGVAQVLPGVNLHFQQSSLVTNQGGATWVLMDGSNLKSIGGPALLENQGTLQKIGGGAARVLTNFNQAGGAVFVYGGELGLDCAVTGVGLLQVDAGALLSMASGGFTTDWGGMVTGAGDVWLGHQRTATFDGIYDIDGWTRVDTDADVHFVTPAETARLYFAGGGTTIRGELTVEDELSWMGGVLKDGRMEVRGLGVIGPSSGVPVVDNSLLLLRSAADVEIDGSGLRGRNGGVVENHGRVVLRDAHLLTLGTSTFRNFGRLEKVDSPSIAYMDFANEGTVVVTNTTLTHLGDHVQNAGRTLLDDGTIDMGNFEIFELLGGKLAGNGTVEGDVHVGAGAMLSPGSPGAEGELLVRQGSLTQDSGSIARFHIGGVNRGIDHDAVTGASPYEIAVGGSLSIELVHGFENQVLRTDAFVLYDSSNKPILGAFDNLASGQRIWTVGGSGSFQVWYGPGSPFPESQVVLTGFMPRSPRIPN